MAAERSSGLLRLPLVPRTRRGAGAKMRPVFSGCSIRLDFRHGRTCPGRGAARSRRCEASSGGAAPQGQGPWGRREEPCPTWTPDQQRTARAARAAYGERGRKRVSGAWTDLPRSATKNFDRGVRHFNTTGKSPKVCQEAIAKIFCFSETANQWSKSPVSPQMRGARDRHERAGRCDGRACCDRRARHEAYGEIVWS